MKEPRRWRLLWCAVGLAIFAAALASVVWPRSTRLQSGDYLTSVTCQTQTLLITTASVVKFVDEGALVTFEDGMSVRRGRLSKHDAAGLIAGLREGGCFDLPGVVGREVFDGSRTLITLRADHAGSQTLILSNNGCLTEGELQERSAARRCADVVASYVRKALGG